MRALLYSLIALTSSLSLVRGESVVDSLKPFVEDKTISGAVALVVNKDKVLALEATGMADLATQKPMAPDAMFWIASMTKPMTAMGIMMLVEEGKVELDAPVAKYLPEFQGQMMVAEKSADRVVLTKPTKAPTVRHLLTHTSGLIDKSPLEGGVSVPTRSEASIAYGLLPLQWEPGSKWQYCNPGINTLGRIIEVVSGTPYPDFMQERFFTPLGMKDTTFFPSEEQMPRVAKSYKQKADPKAGLEETTVRYMTPSRAERLSMPLAAGGLFSTAQDLSHMYRMVLNGGELDGKRYLKAETLKQMATNQTGDLKVSFADGMHMGLGYHIVNVPQDVTAALSPGSFGHGGAYGTQAWIDPVKGLGIVLLIQRAGLPNSDRSDMRAALQKAAMEKFAK